MKPFLLLLALLAVPAAARAAVPNPANCTVDPCLVVCPAGEIAFQIVVRDFANNPVNGSSVVIDFCGCPLVKLCASSTTDPYDRPNACSVRRFTDAAGGVEFKIRAGGGCTGSGVRIFADGVQLATRNVASPDQDGNLMVQLADLTLAVGKLGGTDPTADFDCDGTVEQSDVDYVVPHGGDVCPPTDPTPASRHTWGKLTTIYR